MSTPPWRSGGILSERLALHIWAGFWAGFWFEDSQQKEPFFECALNSQGVLSETQAPNNSLGLSVLYLSFEVIGAVV